MPTQRSKNSVELNTFLIIIMAVASGITVANLYYIQPLLAVIAKNFNTAQVNVSFAATATQIGYAVGMLLILPLADIREKKSLILIMLGCSTVSLLVLAFSLNSTQLIIASFAVGFTSVVPQLIVPIAAQFADPKERGKVIGTVMGGLLFGILVSRTFSGIVGRFFGWRIVFFIAALFMILLAVFLNFKLPRCPSLSKMRYGQLFTSMAKLTHELPVLRESAINGGMMFAAFSVFWTTLSFLLAGPHYHLGADTAGLFGLAGVVGASVAPIAGRLADKRSPRFTISIGMGAITFSYICFILFGFKLAGLVAGVILLDLGVQSGQISNQARVHAISDEARNRINTVYMVSYFVGGSLGSFLGSVSYAWAGWSGVCIVGFATQAVAVAVHIIGWKNDKWSSKKSLYIDK